MMGRRFGVGLMTVALFLTLSGAAFVAENSGSGVLPVGSKPYGKSYGEWSALQWQWLFSLPVDAHPLFDTADCSAGQSGQVWFLGGTFAVIEGEPGVIIGEVERDCTIPAGTALYFPLIDVECSTLEGNGETEEELRDCANLNTDFIIPESVFLSIDGKSVDVSSYRVESPLFTYGPLPDNNIPAYFGLDAPAGTTSAAVSDGYFAMVAPLPVGTHTLHFGGVGDYSSVGGPVFIQDITYHITVVPRGK